ncbi:MAG TPA: hypothetical protein VJV05_01560 [Pyrinomonadaceae bacterium]|nr:hypothetical protein [Pyrinomonadaceae bacterium]
MVRRVIRAAFDYMNAIDPDDRTEWDQAWAAVRHRRLSDLQHFKDERFAATAIGEIVDVTFLEVPNEYRGRQFIENERCPLCGLPAEESDERLEVAVYPVFERLHFGFGAWMHRDCVDKCSEIDEPNPIPW